jgi:hypothetical protein
VLIPGIRFSLSSRRNKNGFAGNGIVSSLGAKKPLHGCGTGPRPEVRTWCIDIRQFLAT